MLWTPLAHNKFAPGLHRGWLWSDIARPAILPLAAGAFAAQFMPWPEGRMALALALAGAGGALLLLAYPLAGRIQLMNRGVRCAG